MELEFSGNMHIHMHCVENNSTQRYKSSCPYKKTDRRYSPTNFIVLGYNNGEQIMKESHK